MNRRRTAALVALLIVALAGCTTEPEAGKGPDATVPGDGDQEGAGKRSESANPVLAGANLRAGCRLPHRWIRAVYRGWDPAPIRDDDIAIVPHPPNYMGSITDTSHSGPYDFLQDVPLLFYGPGHIAEQGAVSSDREVTLVDVAPTMAAAMDFDFPKREGRALTEILDDGSEPPKLIVVAVIDGGGWNVLREWADSWPRLKELMSKGTSYTDATVGSSPSITPATHTNLSTGFYPSDHGVSANVIRTEEGHLTEVFAPVGENTGVANMDATVSLRTTTLADLWDLETDNDALIGMVSPGFLQLGMVGSGAALEGADQDIAAVLSKKRVEWGTNPDLYSLPEYVNTEVRGPARDKQAVDRSDGQVDGLWRGHAISPIHSTPALAPWENRTIKALIEREGFGSDDITDLFYINYKAPDSAGHLYNMIASEQGDTLESVDDAIGELVEWLDRSVGGNEYILVVTADHGQTPLEAGGWPIRPLEIIADLNERFDKIPNKTGVIEDTSAHTLFMNAAEMEVNEVTAEEVANFLFDYTFTDNVASGDAFPDDFSGREDELIFDTAIPGHLLPNVFACSKSSR
jgi:Type I phosphodiesterase / nucleotide pyrophosphatase